MATKTTIGGRRVMTPGEVAEALHADPRTVTRWARRGKITSFMTPGGHRRYWADEVEAIMGGSLNGGAK